MATLLAKKAGDNSPDIATDDEAHAKLVADPTVDTSKMAHPEVPHDTPASTGFGSFTAGAGIASAPSMGGFGSTTTSTTSTSTTSFGSPAFGAPTTGGTMPNSNNVQIVQNQGESIKSSGGAMQEGAESTVKLDKDATDWINKKMRPMMGWIYMLTCTCDFVVFPVLWSVLQAMSHGQVTSQWQPLTLQGAGLYHIAMGAVLGIAAYGRTKEKVAGVAS